MKTSIEFPDSLFRRAKSSAAQKGQTMTAFVTSAVEAKLAADETTAAEKPWMQFAGLLRKDRKEAGRILQRIEESSVKSNYQAKPVTFKGNGLETEFRGASLEQIRDAAYENHGCG